MISTYGAPLSYSWSDPPDDELGYTTLMQFRLVYEGPLKAASNSNTRVREKHAIRKQFHKQLKELWEVHPVLATFRDVNQRTKLPPKPPNMKELDEQAWGHYSELTGITKLIEELHFPGDPDCSYMETLARRYVRSNGFRFVPLVHKGLDLICGLDILFLRRENPGSLISNSGDVDNRIKTLLDALRLPSDGGELADAVPDDDEDPFFCLLEDDRLVTELNIKTDRLLTPIRPDGHMNEVMLIMQVNIDGARYTSQNRGLAK